jgi:hypothetical protein
MPKQMDHVSSTESTEKVSRLCCLIKVPRTNSSIPTIRGLAAQAYSTAVCSACCFFQSVVEVVLL